MNFSSPSCADNYFTLKHQLNELVLVQTEIYKTQNPLIEISLKVSLNYPLPSLSVPVIYFVPNVLKKHPHTL